MDNKDLIQLHEKFISNDIKIFKFNKMLKNNNIAIDEYATVIIKDFIENDLKYTKDTVKDIKEDESNKLLIYIGGVILKYLKPLSLTNNVNYMDVINFVYPNTYTIENMIKRIYKNSRDKHERKPVGIIYNNKDNAENIFYFLLEAALEYNNIDPTNDEEIFKTINFEWLQENKIRSYFNALYTNLEDMYKEQFGVDIKEVNKYKFPRK